MQVSVAGVLDELVGLAAVVGLLLGRVVVVLVAGQRLGWATAAVGAYRFGLLRQQPGRSSRLLFFGVLRRRGELRAVGVRRLRVGAEVVVEGDVLVEDHHDDA